MRKKILAFFIFFVFGIISIVLITNATHLQLARVQIIANPKEPLIANKMALDLQPTAVIDFESEELARMGLKDVSLFDADSKGNLYVCYQVASESSIFKFDRGGKFVRSFGRRGSGPGELQYFGDLKLDKNDVIQVIEYFERKIERFSTEGEFISEQRIPNIVALDLLYNGNCLMAQNVSGEPKSEYMEGHLILGGPEFQSIKTLLIIKTPKPLVAKKINGIRNWYFICASKKNIYVGEAERGYIIQGYDLNGNLAQIIKKDYSPVKITEEDRQRALEYWKGPAAEDIKKTIYFPRYFPPFKSAFTDEEDHLFVITYETSDGKEPVFDIFNSDGILICRTNLNGHMKNGNLLRIVAKNGHLYLLLEKANGYKKLVSLKINWKK